MIVRRPSVRRWGVLFVLLAGLLPAVAARRAPQAVSAAPAGVGAADWQAIQAQLPFPQYAYLKADNLGASDYFGWTVAVDGDTVVVGAHLEDSSSTGVNATPNEAAQDAGAAYVFVRSGAQGAPAWTQQAYLKASNPGAGDYFGLSVAVDGDTIVVGAPQEDSSSRGGTLPPNEFAPDSGAAYVFVRAGTTWTQQAYLKAANLGVSDTFGSSVAVDGDTVVIGAPSEDSSSSGINSTPNEAASAAGAAYVFVHSGTAWSQQAYVKASNTGAGDQFGGSVAVENATVVIGAVGEASDGSGPANNSAPVAGAAYVFVHAGSTWNPESYLKASNTGAGDQFGGSVAVDGDTVVIGAAEEDSSSGSTFPPNESAVSAGAAYVFVRSGSAWTEQAYLKSSLPGNSSYSPRANDYFGRSVAVDGDIVVIGAFGDDGFGGAPPLVLDAGAAVVFVRSGTQGSPVWVPQAYLQAANKGTADQFGRSVAISGATVVSGASWEDSSSGVNAPPNEAAQDAGAAYVFVALHRRYLPLLTR